MYGESPSVDTDARAIELEGHLKTPVPPIELTVEDLDSVKESCP